MATWEISFAHSKNAEQSSLANGRKKIGICTRSHAGCDLQTFLRSTREYLQRKRIKKPATQRDAAKVFHTLVRAGFASRVIFRMLKMWDVDD